MFKPDHAAPSTAPDVLSSPPFVEVQGIINIRQLGGYPTRTAGTITKPNAVFRSGELNNVTEKGKRQLIALGIKRVFDLRAPNEIAQYKSASPEIEGITHVPVPASHEGFDPASLTTRLEGFRTKEKETFVELYDEILDKAAPAYATIFRQIIDAPDEPCLVHCTAGKDRTGVFAVLLLSILGVSDEDIIKDYSLTTHGLQPVMSHLIERVKQKTAYRDNMEGALNMGSSRAENMAATLEMFKERYGGIESYLKGRTSLTDEDFDALRKHLLVPT